jgi:hypothetical protein
MNKEVEEVLEDIKWLKDGCQEWINYSKIGSNGRNISVNKRCCNITQHIKELAEENALLKRDLDTRNLMRKLTVDKLQVKLDKIEGIAKDNFIYKSAIVKVAAITQTIKELRNAERMDNLVKGKEISPQIRCDKLQVKLDDYYYFLEGLRDVVEQILKEETK